MVGVFLVKLPALVQATSHYLDKVDPHLSRHTASLVHHELIHIKNTCIFHSSSWLYFPVGQFEVLTLLTHTWWRHQMETFSALLALCAGNSPVPVNSPHKGQWRGALMFSLICVWINGWVNHREAGDLRRYHVNMTKLWWSHRIDMPYSQFCCLAAHFTDID